jgi:hypothetical protein
MPLPCRALTGIWRMSIRSFKFPGKENNGEDDIHRRITHTTTLFTHSSNLLMTSITLVLLGMETWHLEVFILTNPIG